MSELGERIAVATVGNLIEALKKLPKDNALLLATDEEQNSLTRDIFVRVYEGEIVLLPLNPQQEL